MKFPQPLIRRIFRRKSRAERHLLAWAAVHIFAFLALAQLESSATATTRDPHEDRLRDPHRGGIDGGGDGQRRKERTETPDDPYQDDEVEVPAEAK